MCSLPSKDSNGKLPRFTSLGSYPLIYLSEGGSVLCADCASAEDEHSDPVVNCDVHWEGDPETCEDCGAEIESAYGPVEE